MARAFGSKNFDDGVIAKVRGAVVFDGLSVGAAAARHGVSEHTVRQWKYKARDAGDDWDKARAAQYLAGGSLDDVLRQQIAATLQATAVTLDLVQADGELPPADKARILASLIDGNSKCVAMHEKLMNRKMNKAELIAALKGFTDFCIETKPALAGEMVSLLEGFGARL
ncbi:MAG: DUF1804 family protein [Zoogloeaceae bacterium]|jgi:hypothetical protein|nr:DUF1804 family protein [Zoogloeaceae bacterium]